MEVEVDVVSDEFSHSAGGMSKVENERKMCHKYST